MFHQFGIENFKSWKDKHYISIDDISLLFGKNSSGKSSVLQALMLLKASSKIFDPFNDNLTRVWRAFPKAPINKIVFASTLRDFGRFDDIVHRNSKKLDETQTFSFRIKTSEFTNAAVNHLIKNGIINIHHPNLDEPMVKSRYESLIKKANLLIPSNCKTIEAQLVFKKATLQSIDIIFDKEQIASLKVSNGHFNSVDLTTDPKIWKNFLGVEHSEDLVKSDTLKKLEELNNKSSEFLSSFKERLFNIIHKFGNRPHFLNRPFSDIVALDSGAPNFFESAKNEFQKIGHAIETKRILALHIYDFAHNLSNEVGIVRDRDIVTLTSIKKLTKQLENLFKGVTGELVDEGLDQNLLYPSMSIEESLGRLLKELSSPDWQRLRFIHAREMAIKSGAKNRSEYLAWIRRAQKDESSITEVFSASLNPKEEFGTLFESWAHFLGFKESNYPGRYVHHEPFSKGNNTEGKFDKKKRTDEELEELKYQYHDKAREIISRAQNICLELGDYISSLEKLEEISFENNAFLTTNKSISIERFLKTLKQVSFENYNFLSSIQNRPLLKSILDTQFFEYNRRLGLRDLSGNSVMHFYTDLYAKSQNKVERKSRDINIFYLLTYVVTYLTEGLASIEVLGPHRPPPQRYIRGEMTVGNNAYLAVLNNENKARPEQINLINDALHLLEIPYSLGKMEDEDNSIFEEIKLLDKNKIEVSILDVGYGISQILPIIITAFTRYNKTILIEQPELHLHPKLQANLADIFAISTLSNKNKFLLETHSEHLLLRFMRRRRENFEANLTKQGIDPNTQFLPIDNQTNQETKTASKIDNIQKTKKLLEYEDGQIFFRWKKDPKVKDGQTYQQVKEFKFYEDPDFYMNLFEIVDEEKINISAISIDAEKGASFLSVITLTEEGNYTGEWPDGFFKERYQELGI